MPFAVCVHFQSNALNVQILVLAEQRAGDCPHQAGPGAGEPHAVCGKFPDDVVRLGVHRDGAAPCPRGGGRLHSVRLFSPLPGRERICGETFKYVLPAP